jgi:hypothetical protein
MPTGMSWWAAVLWTLLEIALMFGVPLGAVALSGPVQRLWEAARRDRSGGGRAVRKARRRGVLMP